MSEVPTVTVKIKKLDGTIYAQATINGSFVIDWIRVRPNRLGGWGVYLPDRKIGGDFVPLLHVPDPWYAAIKSAVLAEIGRAA